LNNGPDMIIKNTNKVIRSRLHEVSWNQNSGYH